MQCAKENHTNIMFLTSTFLALVQVVAVYIQTRMMFKMKGWKSKSLMHMRCWTFARTWFSISYVPIFLRTSSPTSGGPLAPSGSLEWCANAVKHHYLSSIEYEILVIDTHRVYKKKMLLVQLWHLSYTREMKRLAILHVSITYQ